MNSKMKLNENFTTIFIVLGFLLAGCGKEQVASDQTPPGTPQFVPRTADTVLVEQGIDAVPEGDYIGFSWEAVTDEDLAGYRIYRMREDSVTVLPARLIADKTIQDLVGLTIPYYLDTDSVLAPDPFTGLSLGFYYWVSAYDQSGNESTASEPAYYKLMPKASLSAPVQPGDSLVLFWNYSTASPFAVDRFVVRLDSLSGGAWTPFWLAQHALFDPLQVVCHDPLPPGGYRYRVNVVGSSPDPSGSEAAVEFTVN
jgi:hypothetical protein